jgi:Tfp pilus assembly protein PilO
MKQSTKKLISMLVALAFLIAAFVFYFDFVSPAYSDIQALKGKELSEQNFFSQESNTITQVQKLIATYKNESQEQATVELALPSGQNVSGALAQIYGIVAANNINLQNVTISVSSVVPNAGSAAVGASSPLLKPVGSISFVVAISGSYEDFKNFLSEIETNVRIFDVKNLSIQPSSQVGSLTKDIFSYNMTITAYYQTQ